jgi:hypothetical protein
MTRADDPDDGGGLGYATREGPTPKLVIVAIVWAGFGVFGLFTALLMKSSGFAIFGVLCIVAGVALYFGQRTRDQLAYDELHLGESSWSAPPDDLLDVDDEDPGADDGSRAHSGPDRDEDILDAEFTEYFDYDQSPADQDDGTGYDDQEMAYQRYQADQWARDDEDDDTGEDDEGAGTGTGTGEDGEHDDVARTSRIPTGDADGEDDASRRDGDSARDDSDHSNGRDHSDHSDHEGSDGRRG